nr:replication protein [Providencia rettgeri]
MWKQALSALSDQQLDGLFKFCIDRCMNGNPWPPELSDVIVALSGEAAKHNPFGLDPDEQLRDFLTYCAKRNNYQSAEMYPFKHPVQYWMFTDLRTKMIDLRLTEVECEKRLDKMLSQWTERVHKGEAVPRPTLKVEDKTRPPPAWMELLEKSKQRRQ